MAQIKTVDSSKRIAKLREEMRKTNTDVVGIAPSANMNFLTGFVPIYTERLFLLLVGLKSAAFVMPALDVEAFKDHTDIPFYAIRDGISPEAVLLDAMNFVAGESANKVVIDETMRADHALMIIKSIKADILESSAPIMSALRIVKDDDDIQSMLDVASLNDQAIEAAYEAIKIGATEKQVVDAAKAVFEKGGGELLYWVVASGKNGAFPHHLTGDRAMQSGDAITIDLAGKKNGFFNDITRQAIIGKGPEGYNDVHAVVEAAVQAGIAAIKPGVQAKAVDQAARKVIDEAGYGEYFVHRTGHGIGLDVHEAPFISADSETILLDGMLFTVEPGIYIPDRFGVRLEEVVVVRNGKAEVLSKISREAMGV